MHKLSTTAVIPITANPVAAVASTGQNILSAWKDYAVTRETETTKRSQIAANRDVALARIKAQAEVLHELISGTFAERGKNFDKFFELLDSGFSSGNESQINAALTLIVEQTKVSPMRQAIELIGKINDPKNNDVIDI